MQIIRLMPIWSISKFQNSLFFLYFFNKDISFNIPWKLLKFKTHVTSRGERVPQCMEILYSGANIKGDMSDLMEKSENFISR